MQPQIRLRNYIKNSKFLRDHFGPPKLSEEEIKKIVEERNAAVERINTVLRAVMGLEWTDADELANIIDIERNGATNYFDKWVELGFVCRLVITVENETVTLYAINREISDAMNKYMDTQSEEDFQAVRSMIKKKNTGVRPAI